MSFITNKSGDLEYLTSELLIDIPHCFSTRYGGVSQGYLSSLNLGVHRGDKPANVWENYRILGQAVGFRPEQTVFTKQVHSNIVDVTGAHECGQGLITPVIKDRDGLITNEPNVALTIFSADCTPILFYDPVTKVIGACHAGWRGTASGIAYETAIRMTHDFGCHPENIRAAIGPCISECCFETHDDVPNAMIESLGAEAVSAIVPKGEKYLVNLKKINSIWLRRAGVHQIDISSSCTCCDPERFWTHRKVGNQRGSLAAVIMLKGDSI